MLQPGQADHIVVPRDWAGNIAVLEHGGGRRIVGDESKIKGSFRWQQDVGDFVFDVNVSCVYVCSSSTISSPEVKRGSY